MDPQARLGEQSPQTIGGPNRRRRWWLVVPFLLLALTTPALIPKPPDGLDFIRKHGPVREVLTSESYEVSRGWTSSSVTVWHREFQFKAITLDLLMELQTDIEPRPIPIWRASILPDGSIATWDIEKGTVNVQLNQDPPWLVRQWHALMNRFSSPPASGPYPVRATP